MSRWVVALLVTLGLWSLTCGTADAGKRVALVVGNGAYQHVAGLPNPTRDAADVATALRSIGFKVKEFENLGRNEFAAALSDFSEEASGAEFAILYYAGHGIEVEKQNYLVPVDAKLANDRRLRFEAVSLDDVLGALEGVKGIRIILLDACRNNPFANSMTITSPSRSIGRGLSRVEASSGTVISYSAKEGTVASDGDGRNSPFATALLANVTKPGLEIQFLLRKMRDSVLASTNGAQEPYISSSLSSEAVYLVPPVASIVTPETFGPIIAPVVPQVQTPEVTAQDDWDAVKTSTSEAVIRAFIATHGDSKIYRALAEERLATLKSKQSSLPPTALPVTKPKKPEKKATAKPTAKTTPFAKANPTRQPARGMRPDPKQYSYSIWGKHVDTNGGNWDIGRTKMTPYGQLHCTGGPSTRKCQWR